MSTCCVCSLIFLCILSNISLAQESGSGFDESVPEVVIELIFSSQVNCSEIQEFFAQNVTLTVDHKIVAEGDDCSTLSNRKKRESMLYKYSVYMINATTNKPDNSKTLEIKRQLCNNTEDIEKQFKTFENVTNCNEETVSSTTDGGTLSTTVFSAITTTSVSKGISSTITSSSVQMISTKTTSSSTPISVITESTKSLRSSAPISESTQFTKPMSSSIPISTTESTKPMSSSSTVVTESTKPTSSSSTVVTESTKPMSSSSSTVVTESTKPMSSSVVTESTQSPTSSDDPNPLSDSLTVIVPAAAFLVLLIIIVIIVFSMCVLLQVRRMRVEKEKRKPMWLPTKPSMGELVQVRPQIVRPLRPSRVSFASRGNILLQTLSHPLSLDELSQSLYHLDKLCDEYMGVPPNLAGMNEIPVGTEDKNRYIDVLPNPNTRVPLFLKFGVAHSDFINANYIRGYRNEPKGYIATQGPLQHTVADFWRMVWEQKVSVIIMTTELIERNMEKCSQYWPDEGGYGVTESYGDIQVTIRKKTKKNFFTITTFTLEHLERHVTREITHYWFKGWPDHGTPSNPECVVDFLLETRTKRTAFTMPGPTLVHCSAGIGRTGVFIAADIGMKQIEENMTVDILKILATLRQDRGGMVQTKEQYIFIHKVLNDYGRRIGHVSSISRYESNVSIPNQFGQTPADFLEEDEEAVTTFK